ncbi:MAG: hypothetical protein WA946_12625 [Nitrospirota bacterium]
MKKFSLVVLVTLVASFFALSGVAQQNNTAASGSGYRPQVKYEGTYKSNLIFFKYTPKDVWRRQPYMDTLQRVSCQDALDHLNFVGKWRGNLNQDGSCGGSSSESPEWATGNRINYDEASGQRAN